MWKRWLPFFIFAALALLLFVGIRLNQVRDPDAIPSPLIGKPVPAFALPSLHDLSRIVRSEELRGTPYLLNVWGSWCGECRVEHPVIDALSRSGRLRVIGYNYKDAPDDAKRWLQRFGDPYALILADETGRSAIDFGIYGAPETFLVDADGVVRFKQVGALTPQIIERDILPLVVAGSAR